MDMKEIKLPMKFNPGLKKYEPELLILKRAKNLKIKVEWIPIIMAIIAITIFIILMIKFVV